MQYIHLFLQLISLHMCKEEQPTYNDLIILEIESFLLGWGRIIRVR